jgi:putative tricarboxylic transport membrane protein
MFFIAIGTYSVNNSLFEVAEAGLFGVMALEFPISPILLGYVLGPMVEENFRRTLAMSHGDLAIFVERPISCVFLAVGAVLILGQFVFWALRPQQGKVTMEAW